MCSKSAMHIFLHLQSGMCWECPQTWLLKSNHEEFPDTFHLEDGEKRALHFLTHSKRKSSSLLSLCVSSYLPPLLFFSYTLLNYSFLLHSLTPYLSSPLIYSSFPSSHLTSSLIYSSPLLLFSPHLSPSLLVNMCSSSTLNLLLFTHLS